MRISCRVDGETNNVFYTLNYIPSNFRTTIDATKYVIRSELNKTKDHQIIFMHIIHMFILHHSTII